MKRQKNKKISRAIALLPLYCFWGQFAHADFDLNWNIIDQYQNQLQKAPQISPNIKIDIQKLGLGEEAHLIDLLEKIKAQTQLQNAQFSIIFDQEIYQLDNEEDLQILKDIAASNFVIAEISLGEDSANTAQSNRIMQLLDASEIGFNAQNEISFENVKNAKIIAPTKIIGSDISTIRNAQKIQDFAPNLSAKRIQKIDQNGKIIEDKNSISQNIGQELILKSDINAKVQNLAFDLSASFENSNFNSNQRTNILAQTIGKSTQIANQAINNDTSAQINAKLATAVFDQGISISIEDSLKHIQRQNQGFDKDEYNSNQWRNRNSNLANELGLKAQLSEGNYNLSLEINQANLILNNKNIEISNKSINHDGNEIQISQAEISSIVNANFALNEKIQIQPQIEAKFYDFQQAGSFNKNSSQILLNPKVELAYKFDDNNKLKIEAAKQNQNYAIDGIAINTAINNGQNSNLINPNRFSTRLELDHRFNSNANLNLAIESANYRNQIANVADFENGKFIGSRLANIQNARNGAFLASLNWQLDELLEGLELNGNYRISQTNIAQITRIGEISPKQNFKFKLRKTGANGINWETYLNTEIRGEAYDYTAIRTFPSRSELGMTINIPYKNGFVFATSVNGIIGAKDYAVNRYFENSNNFGSTNNVTYENYSTQPSISLRIKKGL